MRKLTGTIVSQKMKKTVVVRVDRLAKHPKYLTYYKVSRRYKAHAEESGYTIGDQVLIQETRPLSKEKRWKIIEVIRHSQEPVDPINEEHATDSE